MIDTTIKLRKYPYRDAFVATINEPGDANMINQAFLAMCIAQAPRVGDADFRDVFLMCCGR